MAMAITLALARDRATGKSRPLYFGQGKRIKGMAKIWAEGKKDYQLTVENRHPDASVLLRREHSIRRSFSRILLKTSVRYGNTETKRVKREEGNKKYLNILWDYSGGRLRDIVKSRYVFPKPVQIEKRDGSLCLGYSGTARVPFYPVRHDHLPELDFGDMIRSPLMELVRQCLKYGIPLRTAEKYVDSLLSRLIPFLDYVYTERRSGKSNYVRDGLKELRVVVEQIKRDYGTRNGVHQSITAEVLESVSDDVISEVEHISDEVSEDKEEGQDSETHFLEDAIATAKAEEVVLDECLQTATKLLIDGILTAEDSEELLNEMQEQSRRIGVKVHRFVSKNFQSPFSINGVIYHGTEMAYDNSGLILLSEVPVDGGRGRIDLVLVRAKQLTRVDDAPSIVVCEPFMIIDLKTKNAFDFDIYGVESRSTDKENVVSKFTLERRELNHDEWSDVLSNTPDEYERTQLDMYEENILTDYQRVMWKDVDAQKTLAKAILVIDSYQNWKDISEAILPLVLEAYNGCVDGTLSEGDFLFPSENNTRMKIAMRMLSVSRPTTEDVQVDVPMPMKPFQKRVEDEREFFLYLTVPGSGSPSQSAAMIAERWHGLEYIHGLVRRRHRDVFWFDLVGEYRDPILRKKQFRLKYQTDPIRRFFKHRVQMRDLSDYVYGFVYDGERISSVQSQIHNLLRDSRNPIIVVSGWESFRRSTPDSHSKHLDEVVTTIIQAFPVKSTVVWFARPVPLAKSSIDYSSRCVGPFYRGTLWQNFVDTIVWNVPMPPNRTGARIPTNYHERGIFIERPERPLESMMIEIGPLRNWGQDFQSGGSRDMDVYHLGPSSSLQQSGLYIEKQLECATKLIPHLLSSSEYNTGPLSSSSIDIERVSSGYDSPKESGPRLTFRPLQIHTEMEVDGRVKVLLPIADINRRREYRKMKLDVVPPKRSTYPPSEYYLSVKELDDQDIVLTEIKSLKDTIKFLKQIDVSHLKELLDQLSKVLDDTSDENDTYTLMNKLRLIHQILETNTLSKEVWKLLLPIRSMIPRNLVPVQREHVTSIQTRHPDILMMTGNHLFLLIIAALGPYRDISITESLVSLWNYIRPWHFMGLGLRPEYPNSHNTGRSVLNRHSLLPQLHQRFINSNKSLSFQTSLTNVRFGQLIFRSSSGEADSSYLWLLFQRIPGIFDMNAALLNPRGIDPFLSIVGTLNKMVSERTFWSESDINLLSTLAEIPNDAVRLRMMVADQQGVQGLWIDDQKQRKWLPIGRIHYATRRYEDATLVRTISLSESPHLQPVDYENVRRPIHQTEDMVDLALLIINQALEGCISSTCRVSLNTEENMYRVIFVDKGSNDTIGEILINRTVDLLELLRRPDNECEPVIINGQRLIWNRFKDISYDDDVALLRPWVDRHDPFPGMSLKPPPTARNLLKADKEFDITLELYHDPWTCPLRHISLEDIQKSHQRAQASGPHYMFRYERPWGEPVHVSNEPGAHHGSCWRVHVDTPHTLTPELRKLMQIRFTDAQVRSLLSPQELVYWSEKEQKWVTHTFKLLVQRDCIEVVKESWHLRLMLTGLTGERFEPILPGVNLKSPDKWRPFFKLEPECVVIGLQEKDTGLTRERRIPEQNVALRGMYEVQKLLEDEMREFLKKTGIIVDRRLNAEIQGEIAASIEIFRVSEDKAAVELDGVTIEQDSAGGRVVYVVLISEVNVHKIPVTRHLHDIRQIGRADRSEFESEVKSLLGEFNLSDKDLDRALKECVRIMREEGLIRR